MKYREIAKRIVVDSVPPVNAEMGNTYGEEKPFTPKQVRKIQESIDTVKESLSKKWGIAD